MKETSNHIKDYKRLDVEIITTAANTTAYQIMQTKGAEYGGEAEAIRIELEGAINTLPLNMDEVLTGHFKESETIFFQQSDAHKTIEGDSYLRYKKWGAAIHIWYGSDNGEVCLLVTESPVKVDRLIRLLKGLK